MKVSAKLSSSAARDAVTVRLGFVPLLDAAPLVVAHEQGYFAEEGLKVHLERQLGWGNVSDKLLFGKLHASHALLGTPVANALQPGHAGLSTVAVMALGTGGDAITVDRKLYDAGVTTASMFARYIRQRKREPHPPILAHVFDCSVHHYLLREWLAAAALSPDDDVHLCTLPPAQMPAHLQRGYLAGMCVGEPWNTLAHQQDFGRIVALTTDIAPGHPDKVLAVHHDWAQRNPDAVVRLIRAVVRACAYCDASANHAAVAALLARPEYLDLPAEVIHASLLIDRNFGLSRKTSLPNYRPADWKARSLAVDTLYPKPAYAHWLLERMSRWGHLDVSVDLQAIAATAMVDRYFIEAVGPTGPGTDAPAHNELEFAK